MDIDLLLVEIKKLEPKRDTIVIVRNLEMEPEMREAFMISVSRGMRDHEINALVFFLEDDSDIYMMDKEKMAEFGWVRKDGGGSGYDAT